MGWAETVGSCGVLSRSRSEIFSGFYRQRQAGLPLGGLDIRWSRVAQRSSAGTRVYCSFLARPLLSSFWEDAKSQTLSFLSQARSPLDARQEHAFLLSRWRLRPSAVRLLAFSLK